MNWLRGRRKLSDTSPPTFYCLTYRMQTGMGRLEARSQDELARLLAEIRLAGGYDITIMDADGRLIGFDPGPAAKG